MLRISVNKSIERKRLIYPINFEVIFCYISMYFWPLMFSFITALIVISDIQHNRKLVIPIYFIMVLINLWLLSGIYYANKLYQFSDKILIDRENQIIAILKNYYPTTEFHIENSNLIRAEKEIGWMRARIITIILDDENIYVNILNTYRGENFSPIQGVYNYFRSKKLTRYIYNNLSFN